MLQRGHSGIKYPPKAPKPTPAHKPDKPASDDKDKQKELIQV